VFSDTKLISNLTRGTVLCERTWDADQPLSRMRGLLGRRVLAPGEGVLSRPASSIHTAAMRRPIDVVFVDREFRVVKVVDRLPPWRVAGASQARSALEIAAGEARLREVSVGDRLAVLDRRVDSLEALRRPTGVTVIACPTSTARSSRSDRAHLKLPTRLANESLVESPLNRGRRRRRRPEEWD
jgi:uncharacterized membrane protein (UPF0127 family)